MELALALSTDSTVNSVKFGLCLKEDYMELVQHLKLLSVLKKTTKKTMYLIKKSTLKNYFCINTLSWLFLNTPPLLFHQLRVMKYNSLQYLRGWNLSSVSYSFPSSCERCSWVLWKIHHGNLFCGRHGWDVFALWQTDHHRLRPRGLWGFRCTGAESLSDVIKGSSFGLGHSQEGEDEEKDEEDHEDDEDVRTTKFLREDEEDDCNGMSNWYCFCIWGF